MTRRVRIHAAFRGDLRAQLTWLVANGDPVYIESLQEGLAEVEALLARHPAVGALEARAASSELRRLLLRRAPYVVWYAWDPERGEIWLLRLFHRRQQRPSPTWPASKRRKPGKKTRG